MNRIRLGGSARVVVLALVLALGAGAGAQARAGAPTCSPRGNDAAFALGVQALTGPAGTDVYATVTSSAAGCPAPDVLEKVQVKALAANGSTAGVSNFLDVPASGGLGTVSPAGLSRGQRLEVTALVQTPAAVRTDVLRADAVVRLRPDLVVQRVTAPRRVVRKQPFAVEATIAEVAGDTGAAATVSLFDGPQLLASAPVSVDAAASRTVSFSPLRIALVDTHDLVVRVTDAAPTELDATNDTGHASIAVAMYDGDGVVATENKQATQIGVDVLEAGGNAIDAAAAVQWALNVVEPENSGLGGGVTVLVHLANGRGDFAVDGRETAPAATTPNTYRGKTGVDSNGFGVGVPGTLLAVDEMLNRWGTMSLAQTLEPAAALAENGMVVSKQLSVSATNRGGFYPATAAVFRPNGKAVQAGDILKQPDLAKTFRLIENQGPDVFYRGEIAPAIVAAQRQARIKGNGGTMTTDDLAAFPVDVRAPVYVDYHGYRVVSVGPSTCGGLVLLQALKMVEQFPLGQEPDWGFQSPNATNVMLEALRLAFADREMWMGDDRFFPVPVDALLSDAYLDSRSHLIHPYSRIPDVTAGSPGAFSATTESHSFVSTTEGLQTSHFSISDRWGNVVSFTTSLGDGLGTGIMVPGYGFMLNDSMRNFNTVPRRNEQTGNPGANDAAPGKRAMGNTAPVIVFKGDEPVLATGAAGGAYIMAVDFQIVTNVLDFHLTLQQAVDASRIWGNLDIIMWNPDFPAATLDAMRALGQPIRDTPSFYPQVGAAESLAIDPETFALSGAADPRGLPEAGATVVPPR